MNLHPFDAAMALQPQPDGSCAGSTSPAYWNMRGPYGGITAAIALQAVLQHPDRLGDPIALTVNYAAPMVAGDKLPLELDEAARMDGASPLQLFRLVYLPLMVPSLVAVGTYSLLLAWNEYLYAFLLLSNDKDVTLSVALGNFLSADDSPWELLMATGLIYAAPPAVIYCVFKRYMVGGLTAGAVKS